MLEGSCLPLTALSVIDARRRKKGKKEDKPRREMPSVSIVQSRMGYLSALINGIEQMIEEL